MARILVPKAQDTNSEANTQNHMTKQKTKTKADAIRTLKIQHFTSANCHMYAEFFYFVGVRGLRNGRTGHTRFSFKFQYIRFLGASDGSFLHFRFVVDIFLQNRLYMFPLRPRLPERVSCFLPRCKRRGTSTNTKNAWLRAIFTRWVSTLLGIWAVVCIMSGPPRWGQAVADIGCRLHLGQPSRRPRVQLSRI